METIKEYLQSRTDDNLAIALKAIAALDALADAGREADALLMRAEALKARLSRSGASSFEETLQTLRALSREAWAGHAAALDVTQIVKQLAEVETRLSEAADSGG